MGLPLKPATLSILPSHVTTEPCLFDRFIRDGFAGTLPEKNFNQAFSANYLSCTLSSSSPTSGASTTAARQFGLIRKRDCWTLAFQRRQIPDFVRKSIRNSTLPSSTNIPEKLERPTCCPPLGLHFILCWFYAAFFHINMSQIAVMAIISPTPDLRPPRWRKQCFNDGQRSVWSDPEYSHINAVEGNRTTGRGRWVRLHNFTSLTMSTWV